MQYFQTFSRQFQKLGVSTVLLSALLMGACTETTTPVEGLFKRLCGQSYEGTVISQDPQDANWRGKALVLGPVDCRVENFFLMPLAVGENKTRTWVLTRIQSGIETKKRPKPFKGRNTEENSGKGELWELRHHHYLSNGMIDPVSDYGGRMLVEAQRITSLNADASETAVTWKLDFPADLLTREIFTANGLQVSNTNVWSLILKPDQSLTYQLRRKGRDFRAEFDLANPLRGNNKF